MTYVPLNTCIVIVVVYFLSYMLKNFFFQKEEMKDEKESFQGFIKVVLNLVRPISMSLGARPPSIYEVLTREHIVEQNTQNISFYMPRDTVRSIHATR